MSLSNTEKAVKDARRSRRCNYSTEAKTRIVRGGFRGEHGIAEICRREGIYFNLNYRWNKAFLEAGKNFFVWRYSEKTGFRKLVCVPNVPGSSSR
ncbi:MAG: transposase [Pseudomonadales bacterium]